MVSLVFFGSGPVAAASLRGIAPHFEIEAVITKPALRRSDPTPPVIEVAEALNLPIRLTPDKAAIKAIFDSWQPTSKLGLVVDYGFILSRETIDHFPLGIVNSHFSLLPRWRGADPITFSILEGDQETGISLMLIDEGLDTGLLLSTARFDLDGTETNETLTERLVSVSNRELIKILPDYIDGKITPFPQPDEEPTYSRKLAKNDGEIRWAEQTAEQIERQVRAFSGWPRSSATFRSTPVTITAAHVGETVVSGRAGEPVVQDKELLVPCASGVLVVDKLQPAGKRPMDAISFINGYLR